jgi:hypothetical protein
VQWTSLPTGLGVAAGWLTGLVGGPDAAASTLAAARLAGTALTVVAIAALFWWAWRHAANTRAVVTAAGWALLAAVVLAPAFHPWYLLWAVVPLAASVHRPEVFRALAIASAALCFLVLPDGFNLARVTVVPGVLLDVAVAAALVWYGVRWVRLRRAPASATAEPSGVAEAGVVP